MDIKEMVVLCTTIFASVVAICFASVMLAHRNNARSWARAFRNGAGIRIVATLFIILAAMFLAAAGLLTEPLLVLLSATVGFLLGGTMTAFRSRRAGGGERRKKRRRGSPRKLLILISAWLTASYASAADAPRPNIIFILADDMGLGDLGCYGGHIAPTPNIDRLATEGIRFEQYYAASPVCSPSRCGLITGQFPAHWRITSFLNTKARNRGAEQADFLDPQAPSLPRALHNAGYRTAHFGKWHLGGGRDVTDAPKFAAYGYDEHAGTWESPEPDPKITATNWVWSKQDKVKRWDRSRFYVDKTLDFLRRNKEAPCFVNLWLDDVHTPWIPGGESQQAKAKNVVVKLAPVLSELDRQIGRLLDGMKELGIDERTLIVFASDNGPNPKLKDRTNGLRGCKVSLYEGGIRLPLITRWPGTVRAGATDTTTVITAVDMFPTFCTIAGVKPPAGMVSDGLDRSAALLHEPLPTCDRPIMWEYGRNEEFFNYPKQAADRSPNLAIRDGRWKLLINASGQGAELYDLSADPNESHNVAADHPEVAARLQQSVLEWRRSLP